MKLPGWMEKIRATGAGALGARSAEADDPAEGAIALTARAQIEIAAAEDGKPAKLPTFAIAAYDGSVMRLDGFFTPVIIDLAGVRAHHSVKAFRDHDDGQIVGHVTKTDISAQGITVEGVISGTGEAAKEVVANSRNGFPWEASVGGGPPIRREFLEQGKTAVVNGRQVTGPLIIAREWVMKEVSFVGLGAAEQTRVAIAAKDKNESGGETMTFEKWLKAKGFDIATLTAAQTKFMRAAWKAETQQGDEGDTPAGEGQGVAAGAATAGDGSAEADEPDAPPTNPGNPGVRATGTRNGNAGVNAGGGGSGGVSDAVREMRAEAARQAGINAMASRFGNPSGEIDGQQVNIAAHAIAEGLSLEQTELHMLRANRPQTAPFGHANRGRDGLNQSQVIEASICRAGGMSEDYLADEFSEQVLNASDERPYRGFGIQRLIQATLHAQGHHSHGGVVDNQTIEAALRLDPGLNGQGIQASGFSTISLSGILSNVANKALLERFDMMESALQQIASETDTNDFKPFTRYRLDGDGSMLEVGPDGELKHISLQESTFTNQLQTRGGMISLTRQMMINDDLGAFMQIPQLFGDLAFHAREELGFTRLLANTGSFFGSGNKNYFEGATSALGVDSVSTAVQKFREKKNKNEKFVMVSPGLLLVPPAIETVADQIYASTELRGQSATEPTANTHKGKFKPVVSPHLGTEGGISGSSDTAWYLLAKPRPGLAVLQIGYLKGARRPVIESAQAAFNVLGIQWRSYFDFGIALHEYRAGVKSKGAA